MKKLLLSITALAVAGASIAQTNLNLETWQAGNPAGWVTSNLIYAPTTVLQVTGNASTSAMQITTDSVADLQSGTPDTTGFAFQIIPNAPTYSSIQFDYRTSYIGTTDTGYVSIVFLDNGSTYGATIKLLPTPNWYSTPAVSISSLYTGAAGQGIATDSVIISVYSSSASTPIRGNAVTIDNIILTSSTAGIYEVFSNVNVKTFPNPTSDVVNFEIDNDENLTINIYSLNGALVKTVAKTSTLTSVSLNEMDNGTYVYKVARLNGNIIKTGKFIKQ